MKENDKELEKYYRVFKLIQLLSRPPYRTVPRLAKNLGVTVRSIYRYLHLLERLEYMIERKPNGAYFIVMEHFPDHKLVDADEAAYLQDLLWQTNATDPRRDQLLHKLNKQYTLTPIAQSLSKFKEYEHIKWLGKALEQRRRVKLQNYHPGGDAPVGTRYVEPVEFLDGYTYIWCFNIEKEEYRQYKVSRIGNVELLDEPITGVHEGRALDLFGLSGPSWLPVRLELTSLAHTLLLEEYPNARPFTRSNRGSKHKRDTYFFDGQVKSWLGIGRWVLGLPGEVFVREPEEFKIYLRTRAEKSQW